MTDASPGFAGGCAFAARRIRRGGRLCPPRQTTQVGLPAAKVGNSLVKEGGIRYNHTRNCTGKGDASMYGIGQQAVHPVHGAGITEGVPEELPHEAAVMTGVYE